MNELMEAAHWALEHFYHMDKANATMHCAPVKFSPITFRLAGAINVLSNESPIVREVMRHKGRYDLDEGR